MNLKDTITRSLLLYPTIYPNRLAVYNHLFCVIGNGYDWEKGQLVPPRVKKIKLVPPTKEEAILIKLGDELKEDWEGYIEFEDRIHPGNHSKKFPTFLEQLKKDIKAILDVEERFDDLSIPEKEFSRFPFNFYPLSKHSKMCCIPDDIREDWIQAINELVEIMKKNPDRVVDPENWLPRIEIRIQEIKEKNGWS